MGLDIYLYDTTTRHTRTEDDRPKIITEKVEVGDFRKFGALFGWVNNNISIIGNCKDIMISKEKILELLSMLETLTKDNCSENFPTCSGFFFGSTDYDEWYWEDVDSLKTTLSIVLEKWHKEEESEVYRYLTFHAWW